MSIPVCAPLRPGHGVRALRLRLLSLRGELCLLLVLQHAVGDLAHQRLGQLLPELDVVGHGVLGNVLAAVVQQLPLRLVVGGDAALEHHKRLHLLHLVGIGHADDTAHLHVLMGVQNILQLTGIHVVAGGNDHPLGASLEVDEALLVHGAQIAGIHPRQPVRVLPQRMRRLLGVVHVLLHDGGARQQDLALLAVGHLLVGVGSDDLDIGVGEGQTDGALLIDVGGGQAAGGHRLRGAVALPHLNDRVVVVQEPVELLLQLNGQAVAAGEHALQTAEVGAVHAGQPQQRLVQSGHTGDKVALVLHDLLGVALGGEPGDEDAPSALGQHGVDAHAQPEAVEQGHGGQHPVAGTEHGIGGDDLLSQRVEVAVGQHDALGGAGGAAGVQDHGGVVKAPLHPVALVEAEPGHIHKLPPPDDRRVLGDLLYLPPLGEHIARPDGAAQGVLHGGDDDVDDLGVLPHVLELVVELIQRNGGGGLRGVQIELDLLLRR